jgi:hypothetical protein
MQHAGCRMRMAAGGGVVPLAPRGARARARRAMRHAHARRHSLATAMHARMPAMRHK